MKYKVLFKDWMSEEHVKAMKALLESMINVKILEREDDGYTIAVAEDTVPIIKDMDVCDYLMATELGPLTDTKTEDKYEGPM